MCNDRWVVGVVVGLPIKDLSVLCFSEDGSVAHAYQIDRFQFAFESAPWWRRVLIPDCSELILWSLAIALGSGATSQATIPGTSPQASLVSER